MAKGRLRPTRRRAQRRSRRPPRDAVRAGTGSHQLAHRTIAGRRRWHDTARTRRGPLYRDRRSPRRSPRLLSASPRSGLELPALEPALPRPRNAPLCGSGAPRHGVGAAYGLVSLAFVWDLFGSLLSAPAWLLGLSPFNHVGLVPAQPFRLNAAAADRRRHTLPTPRSRRSLKHNINSHIVVTQ